MKSVMQHNFSRIPAPQIQRSVFDRSHGHKTTFDAGYLVPVYVDEVLPGDTVKMQATFFGRLSTMIFPIMDNMFLDCFFFFIPNRLLWDNWERFNGAQDDPGDSIDFTIPIMKNPVDPGLEYAAGTLSDFFGLPVLAGGITSNDDCPSALPYRAYNLVWNTWFRDQNLQNSAVVDRDNGPDDITDYVLLRRGKKHDYFTSCLPWPQKGDAVSLPLGTSAPVIGDGNTLGFLNGAQEYGTYSINASGALALGTGDVAFALGTAPVGGNPGVTQRIGVHTDPDKSGLIADLTNALPATINQLREAFAFQKVIERDARGGTRYVELLKSHFGVTSPDFRLQRPEYLGGYSQRINVSQVQQTSSTDATTPQGNLAAFGQVSSQAGFNKSFVEHGWILGLANVRADISYQEGINRMWSRQTRYDFYLPALAHLGEQPVYNREIFYEVATPRGVFGYQERWAEYRYKPSMVTGRFRSNHATSLDSWHLALDFAAVPALNAAFIVDDPPIDRVIAVDTEPHIILDCYFSLKHARPMPVYSVPGQIDRF